LTNPIEKNINCKLVSQIAILIPNHLRYFANPFFKPAIMTVSTAMRLPFSSAYNKSILPFHHSTVNYNPQYIEKMAKFHHYTKADNTAASTRPLNDEESSTISAHENKADKCELLQDVFRRRLDASDENMEQFWIIKQASPIDESDNEDEETDA
jgi:antitoxin component of RelBE/YafQ-DinJ toxin-antitoxin module